MVNVRELALVSSLLFLDEPTTGFYSFTAKSVMKTLGGLASKDKSTVNSTIHQPNSKIMKFSDRLVLLANRMIIYFNKAAEFVVN